jgi:hypothetical protein
MDPQRRHPAVMHLLEPGEERRSPRITMWS